MNFESRLKQAEGAFGGPLFYDEMRKHGLQKCCNILSTIQIPDPDRQPSLRLCPFGIITHLTPNVPKKPLHDSRGGAVNGQLGANGPPFVFVSKLEVSFSVEKPTEIAKVDRPTRNSYASTVRSVWSYFYPRHGDGALNRRMGNARIPGDIGHTHPVLVCANDLCRGVVMQGPAARGTHDRTKPVQSVVNGGGTHSVLFGKLGGRSSIEILILQLLSRGAFAMDGHATLYHEDDWSVQHA